MAETTNQTDRGNIRDIRVPDIGNFTDVAIVEVFVKPGERVAAEDSLISLESDKAVMDIPSPLEGTLTEIAVQAGDTVSEGDLIARIETSDQQEEIDTDSAQASGEEPSSEEVQSPEKILSSGEEPSPGEVSSVSESPALPELPDTRQQPGGFHHASPSVRQYARELGVALAAVAGTGPKGRITREDVQTYVKQQLAAAEQGSRSALGTAGGSLPEIPLEDYSRYGAVEEVPLGRIPKRSGPHLHASWLNVPLVTHFDEADVTGLEEFRKGLNAERGNEALRLSVLPFMIKAVVRVLREFPKVNATLNPQAQTLVLKHYYHIGIAVDTPEGLVVPVIRDADRKSIVELGEELSELSARARAGKLKAEEFQGGSFSISSLGGIGGTGFTPLVNAPQAAILGVSRAAVKPVWNGTEFLPRTILPFSLSYDHRVIDGAEGARFCRRLSGVLEAYRSLAAG